MVLETVVSGEAGAEVAADVVAVGVSKVPEVASSLLEDSTVRSE